MSQANSCPVDFSFDDHFGNEKLLRKRDPRKIPPIKCVAD